MPYEPGPYSELLLQLQTPRQRAEAARVRLGLAHPAWLERLDARLTILSSVCNVLRSAEMSLVVLDVHMSSVDWWRALKGPRPNIKDVAFDQTAFSQISKDALLVFGLGSIENGLRCILRALDPTAASNATKEFKSVYDCLFRSKLGLPPEFGDPFDFARLLRNTIHNEGVHFPPSPRTQVVRWRGDEYAFVAGVAVEFATWANIINLVDDLVAAAIGVVDHDVVSSFHDHMPDHGAFLYEGAG
jgi:hypothetical protein